MVASFRHTRPTSRLLISPTERARITVITVCDPALPPVPISMGMKKERATTASSCPWKCCSTVPV